MMPEPERIRWLLRTVCPVVATVPVLILSSACTARGARCDTRLQPINAAVATTPVAGAAPADASGTAPQ